MSALWVKGTTSGGETFELQLTNESTLSLSGPFTLPERFTPSPSRVLLDEWFSGIDESTLVSGLSVSETHTFLRTRYLRRPGFSTMQTKTAN